MALGGSGDLRGSPASPFRGNLSPSTARGAGAGAGAGRSVTSLVLPRPEGAVRYGVEGGASSDPAALT